MLRGCLTVFERREHLKTSSGCFDLYTVYRLSKVFIKVLGHQ